MQRLPRAHRSIEVSAVFALLAAACQAPAAKPEPAPSRTEPVTAPSEPAAAQSRTNDAAPPTGVPAVADEFAELLAGMGVRYLAKEARLEVAGWVNMQSGLVEVFACAPEGKTHESVVVLDCVPSGLQAGLIALGLEPGDPVEFGTGDQYRAPTGDRVLIEVRWLDAAGKEQLAHAEDWVRDDKHQHAMERGGWIFAGSFLQPVSGTTNEVTFAADYVKSLVTTYHDASSILENPLADGIDDTVYYSNEKAVPPVGTPITAIFRRAK
jgi:hypothetical protein